MIQKKLASVVLTTCLAAGLAQLSLAAETTIPAHITAAVADSSRPQADRDRDAARKPAEVIAFAGIKPGDKVADLLPGRGYFTRIFSNVVGSSGHVYAFSFRDEPELKAFAEERKNITFTVQPMDQINAPEPLDVIWTSLNYHDVANREGGTDTLNQFAFRSLKPGGTYIVIDHAASPDAPADVTSKLHRINPEVVKKQVLAAGFELAGESDVLRNPDDPRTSRVHDPSVKGRTDQFVLKFRKPKG